MNSVRILTFGLSALAVVLMIVAFFVHGDPQTIQKVEDFSIGRQAILTSIGTIILIGALTFVTTYISNHSASNRDLANRRIAAELKIAEFRQAWINSLREALSEFHSYGTIPGGNPKLEREFYRLGTKIELLMNPNDPDYGALQECLYRYLDASDKEDIEKYRLNTTLIDLSQGILKREWDRLKRELRSTSYNVGPQ